MLLPYAPINLMPSGICYSLSEGIQELGLTEVEELLLDWLYSFLTAQEQERLWAPTLQREMGWAPEAGKQGHSS